MNDNNFATFLNSELSRRQSTNTNYSLRAFARDLNIEPSLLSKILRKKIPITLKMLERLAPSAGLQEPELKSYRDFVRSSEGMKHINTLQDKYIRHEEFKLIQEWYHMTIVELTLLSDFQPTASWISRKLGISENEASMAVERLIFLGFLERTEDGAFKKSVHGSPGLRIVSEDYSSYIKALRQVIHQFGDKAMQSMHETPAINRANTALTVAIDSSLVLEAKKKIINFTRSLVDDLEKKSKIKNNVYELMVSFFPLTKE